MTKRAFAGCINVLTLIRSAVLEYNTSGCLEGESVGSVLRVGRWGDGEISQGFPPQIIFAIA
ncbi:MAG: hypothetical protein F6K63_19375 [Moorea sp. SIO1G6]|uniref:Uncharacterized protein n=1 Tax=Moorena producens (strain JHB) TaxID=1454205 RepID=A0A9Q9UWI5_MOOP1|nr:MULTISPECIES: hypothetical protein [Moorena]NET66430.1 hypothetical protein [Moorena sp. SIO1G6]WAN69886.1 hypothetical protein BJP36_37990 [Moorena producens JHB]